MSISDPQAWAELGAERLVFPLWLSCNWVGWAQEAGRPGLPEAVGRRSWFSDVFCQQ